MNEETTSYEIYGRRGPGDAFRYLGVGEGTGADEMRGMKQVLASYVQRREGDGAPREFLVRKATTNSSGVSYGFRIFRTDPEPHFIEV